MVYKLSTIELHSNHILILKQSANDQVHKARVHEVYLGSPVRGKRSCLSGSTFGCSTSSYSLTEAIPSGIGVSNLVSVARSHAKKWWVALPAHPCPAVPLVKAIPPKPSPATGT